MDLLKGIKVIEVASFGSAGPFWEMLLADLGADAIVVE